MRRSRVLARSCAACALLAVLAVFACGPEDQRTETLDVEGSSTRARLPTVVVEALDSGSAAFREDDFERALEHYTRAAELAPNEASGWYGVAMAHAALGRDESAAEALEKAQKLAPAASLVHPTPDDTLR